MPALRARLALLLLVLATAACGDALDTAVVAGAVTLHAPDAEAVVMTHPLAFVRRARVVAGPEGARLRVDCDGTISAASAAEGVPGTHPGPGIVAFDLEPGAILGRRDQFAFDLLEGVAHVHTGPVPARLIVMTGRCHVSADATDNRDGIDVVLTAKGDQLRAEVVRGTVLLNATDEAERDTVFVTLHAGDVAVAKEGEAPRKGTTDWFE